MQRERETEIRAATACQPASARCSALAHSRGCAMLYERTVRIAFCQPERASSRRRRSFIPVRAALFDIRTTV